MNLNHLMNILKYLFFYIDKLFITSQKKISSQDEIDSKKSFWVSDF